MKPITDPTRIEQCGRLLREMMLTQEDEECEFNPSWIQRHNWKVVPVESMARIPVPDIPRIVSALNAAGYTECVAVFNEAGYIQNLPLIVASEAQDDLATCHVLSINEAGFKEFNRKLGPFRSVLTTEQPSWGISCNEWYNLFGAKPELLEALLGKPIEEAQQEFHEFASLLAKGDADHPLLQAANLYASL